MGIDGIWFNWFNRFRSVLYYIGHTLNLLLPIQKMKLVFIPDQEVHSHAAVFPIRFVVSEEKSSSDLDFNFSGTPNVMVYDNTCFEDQLPNDVDIEIREPINGCLQVKCRADKSGVIADAIKAALFEFNSNFEGYDIVAEYTLTPQS